MPNTTTTEACSLCGGDVDEREICRDCGQLYATEPQPNTTTDTRPAAWPIGVGN